MWPLDDGNLLIGTNYELLSMDAQGVISSYNIVPGISKVPVYCSFIEYNDAIFCVDGGRLLKLDGDSVIPVNSLNTDRVWPEHLQVFEDDLWVFGNEGAARLSKGEWKYYFPPE